MNVYKIKFKESKIVTVTMCAPNMDEAIAMANRNSLHPDRIYSFMEIEEVEGIGSVG